MTIIIKISMLELRLLLIIIIIINYFSKKTFLFEKMHKKSFKHKIFI